MPRYRACSRSKLLSPVFSGVMKEASRQANCSFGVGGILTVPQGIRNGRRRQCRAWRPGRAVRRVWLWSSSGLLMWVRRSEQQRRRSQQRLAAAMASCQATAAGRSCTAADEQGVCMASAGYLGTHRSHWAKALAGHAGSVPRAPAPFVGAWHPMTSFQPPRLSSLPHIRVPSQGLAQERWDVGCGALSRSNRRATCSLFIATQHDPMPSQL